MNLSQWCSILFSDDGSSGKFYCFCLFGWFCCCSFNDALRIFPHEREKKKTTVETLIIFSMKWHNFFDDHLLPSNSITVSWILVFCFICLFVWEYVFFQFLYSQKRKFVLIHEKEHCRIENFLKIVANPKLTVIMVAVHGNECFENCQLISIVSRNLTKKGRLRFQDSFKIKASKQIRKKSWNTIASLFHFSNGHIWSLSPRIEEYCLTNAKFEFPFGVYYNGPNNWNIKLSFFFI